MAKHRLLGHAAWLCMSFAFLAGASCATEEEASESVTGTLVRSIGRANDGSTLIEYHLKTKSGWIRLRADQAVLERQQPNTRVTAQGRWALDGQELTVDTLRPDTKPGQISQPLSSTAPKGKVAIFLIKDQTMADPFPEQDAINTILQGSSSTNAYLQEASFGAMGLSGDVFGWYSVDMSTCDSPSPFTHADQVEAIAAAQDGYVTDNYRHAIHIFQRNGDACFLAFGSFGAPEGVGRIWSFFNSAGTMAHEVGHNLGLHHANSYTCTNSAFELVPFSTRCTSNEYFDPYDAMGFDGFYYHFNSYSKQLQGWIPEARQQRVTAPGQFTLVPQETAASSGIQSLVVPVPNSNQLIHVEMRRQFGFDNEARFEGAVLVRRVVEPGLFNFTHLIDMSPDGNPGEASLGVGQTFQDPLSGISVGLVSRNANQAVVSVAFNGPNCDDGVQNGSETGLDCGGVCDPCADGQGCVNHRDCSGFACSAGVCVASDGGLTGHYYSGLNFDTLGDTRIDKAVDFEWGSGSPVFQLPADQFSVRWLGQVVPPASATYTFRTDTDDGARLWVDNQLIIDRWFDGVGPSEGTITLTGGQPYDIRLEYFENGGSAYARLLWSTPGMPLDLIPPTALIPAEAGCSIGTALDLGGRNAPITVASDACVKVSQYPSWWVWTNGLVTLQSGTGSFPVPVSWEDGCTSASGSFSFSTAWQSQPIGHHTDNCPVLIQLGGNGSPVQLTWW